MTDLQYPLGKFQVPDHLTSAEQAAAIQALARLPQSVREAVSGLDDGQLDTPYRPGGWTVRQVVHHLPDSHVNAYVRFKLALTEAEPRIKPYLEERWAELPDSRGPIASSLTLLEGLHGRWVSLLGQLPADALNRTLYHPDLGVLHLYQLLALYAWHGPHHVAHVTRLRERMGW
jgi:hypothetical protein